MTARRSPSTETLLRYVAGTLPEDEAERVMAHLAADDRTFARVRGIELMRREFEAFWSVLEATLARAGEATTEVRAVASLRLAVRGLLDGAQGMATAAADLVARASASVVDAFDLVPAPVFGGTASSQEIATQSLVHEASRLLGEGADADARARLGEVLARDRRVAGIFALDVLLHDQVVGRIEVAAAARSVTVTLRTEVAARYPVAVLAVADEPTPREASFRDDPTGSDRRATFTDVPDGTFRVELLPTRS
jgi:anti-sigma factor RsiW